MKKLITWLYYLPSEIRDRAITNTINQRSADALTERYPNLSSALMDAFNWGKSKECLDYWVAIDHWIKEGLDPEDLPDLPLPKS